MTQRKLFSVYGRVQGVGFRYFTLREAQKIGVCGTVRNRSDGSVQVIAQGSNEQMEQFHQWLKIGPPTAKVEQLLEQDYQGEQEFFDFTITH